MDALKWYVLATEMCDKGGGCKDRIQLGSGASGLKVVNRSGDAFLYQHGDLMAVVEDAAGDLQRRGSDLV